MNTSRTTGSTKKLIMWYKIKELFSKGQSYSQISRNLGIDRHRVSQYARMSEEEFLSSGAYCRSYTHKMDAYEFFVLNELRSCPSYSGKQIEDHLKETYGDALNGICSKTIFNYVVHIRAKYSIPKFERPPRPYEKLPELPFGEYGQVDFGEYWMQRPDLSLLMGLSFWHAVIFSSSTIGAIASNIRLIIDFIYIFVGLHNNFLNTGANLETIP